MKYFDIVNKIPSYELVGEDCKIFAKDYLDYILKYDLSHEDSRTLDLGKIVGCLNEKVNEKVKIPGSYTSSRRPLVTIKVNLERKKKAQQMLELLNEYC